MDVSALLIELYGRVPPLARGAVEGLSADELHQPPGPGINSVAWLIWHLARVQDHHISELLEDEQLWVTGEWAGRLALAADPNNTGYGHTADDVAAVRPTDASVLLDYLDAVHHRTEGLLAQLEPEALDRIVDRRWDPPVSLGVRLVSVADDCLQHVGQAAYARGLVRR